MSDGERRRGRRQRWYEWQSLPLHHHHRGANTTDESPEPAHATTTQEQIAKWLLPRVFGHPEQLRADESSEHARHRRIAR